MAENLDPEVITRLNEAYRNQYESLRDTNLLSEAQLKAEKAKIDLSKNSIAVFQASTKAVESFTRALISNESSFKQITTMGAAVADTAAEAAKQLGGIGAVMGVAIQAATKLAQAMAAQAEAVVKTKDQITKFGAAGALSSDKLLDLAHNAGYYSLNMNKLYAAAGKAGGDLLIFSKNMSGGVETFAKMTAVGEGTLQTFNSLGISQEELANYQADYVKYLASSGIQLNANQKTQAALTKGSLEYTKNVLELSALTGKDVDTVKKKQQEAQASLDIQIHYGKLQAQAAELRLAGDEKGAKALEDQIEKEKAIIEKVALTYDSATAAAVRNALATGGAYTEVSANLAAAGVDINKLVKMSKDESLTAGQASAAATEEIAKGVQRSLKTFGDSMIFTGDSLGKQVLGSTENIQALSKGAAEAIANQKTVAEQIANPTADYLKSMQNAFDQFTRKAQQEGDKILQGVNPFMNDMATVMKNAKKIMEDAWDSLKKNILEPANKFIKDVFGIDLMTTTKTVIEALAKLAVQAQKLWEYFGGLNGILEKLFSAAGIGTGVGAAAGGVVGGVIAGPMGAAAGAAVGGAVGGGIGYGYQKVRDYFSSSDESGKTRSMAPGGGGASGGPTGTLKGNTSGLDSDLQKRLMAAAAIYGKPLTINSGFRSSADQQRLYDETVKAGRPGWGPTGMRVGKPGASLHEKGLAVDIAEYKDPAAVAALRSQGLMQTVRNDPVHFEISGPQTAAASGSSSASGTSVQSSSPSNTAVSASDDNMINVMIDIKNSIGTKMQEMVDKVAESNNILEKIMRRS